MRRPRSEDGHAEGERSGGYGPDSEHGRVPEHSRFARELHPAEATMHAL